MKKITSGYQVTDKGYHICYHINENVYFRVN